MYYSVMMSVFSCLLHGPCVWNRFSDTRSLYFTGSTVVIVHVLTVIARVFDASSCDGHPSHLTPSVRRRVSVEQGELPPGASECAGHVPPAGLRCGRRASLDGAGRLALLPTAGRHSAHRPAG